MLLLLTLASAAIAGDALLPDAIAAHGRALAAAQGAATFLSTDAAVVAALEEATRKLDGVSVRRVDDVDAAFAALGQACALRASPLMGAVHVAVLGDCPAGVGLPPAVAVPPDRVVAAPGDDPLQAYRAARLYLAEASRRHNSADRTPAMGGSPGVTTVTQSVVTYPVVCRGDDRPLSLSEFGALTGDPDTEGNTFLGGLSDGWASLPAVFSPRPRGLRVTLPAAAFDEAEAAALVAQFNGLLRARLGLDEAATAALDGQPSGADHPALEWCRARAISPAAD